MRDAVSAPTPMPAAPAAAPAPVRAMPEAPPAPSRAIQNAPPDHAGRPPPAIHELPAPVIPPPAAAPPGTPTTHVGKYTLYETIGEGAFGKVKLGVNRSSGARVAVKIMDKKEIREQDLSAQVRREIYIMRSLVHKHIVRMHEVLTSNTKLYIVMELVTGGELFERLEKHGRVDEALARRYFQQLVDGVDFCHKSGVAHRDLKPENLLLDDDGNIKLTDFGFSTMKSVDVNAGLLYTQCGTPDYCAPEIIERVDAGYNGAKVDVWSCGIILYALLVGGLPFREDETEKLYDMIIACDVHYPPFLSPPATDLLRKLLVRNPAERASMADIKRDPWFLQDYKGDDARALKKSAFYNKAGYAAPLRSATPTPAPPSPKPASPPPPAASPAAKAAALRSPPAGRVAAMVRAHERQEGPADPAAAPQQQDVFTMVQDRPATPASRGKTAAMAPSTDALPQAHSRASGGPGTLAATRSAAEAAEHRETAGGCSARYDSDEGEDVDEAAAAPSGARAAALAAARTVPAAAAAAAGPAAAAPAAGPAAPAAAAPAAAPATVPTPAAAPATATTPATALLLKSDSSSDDDEEGSVEDYRSKPVPMLNLPTTERFVRHQTAQEIRYQQQHLSGPSATARHRSDTHVRVAAGVAASQAQQLPLQQLQMQQPQQAAGGAASRTLQHRSSSPSAAAVTGGIGARAASPFRRSAAAAAASPLLAGRPVRYVDSPMDKQPATFRFPAAGNTAPWHETRAEQPAADAGVGDGPWLGASQAEALSLRMWGLFERWRSSAVDEPVSPHVAPELRMDHRAIQGTLASMTDVQEKLAVYEQFMSLFGKHGLGDVTGEHDSSTNLRRFPTDLSSEDDAGWSPTIYEPARNKSDLARRRDMSDLLTKWIRKYSGGSTAGARENSTDGPFGGSEDGGISMDIAELHRLMKQHHGGRDDSNLAEELERLMRSSEVVDSAGDSPSFSSLTGSPAPPEATGSVKVGLHTRWNSPNGDARTTASGGGSSSSGSRLARGGSHGEYASGSVGGHPPGGSAGRLGESLAPPASPAQPMLPRGGRKPDMATSMGLDDVEYYGSDRRGVSTKLKSVLTQMKARNQRLLETTTYFQSSQEPDSILNILSVVLRQLGAQVQLKKETKRKFRCTLPMEDGVLHAGIELSVTENGFTTVAFRRSRQDRGKTDTRSFTTFYETVRQQFIAEVQAMGTRSQRRIAPATQSSGRKGLMQQQQTLQVDEQMYPLAASLAGDLQVHSQGGGSSRQPHTWSRTPANRGTEGRSGMAPRAASDMR